MERSRRTFSCSRISLGSIVSKAKEKASLIATALEAAGEVIDPNNFNFGGIEFGLPGGGAGSGCDVGPVNCGPPIVEFFGGKGSGATANAIIGTGLSVLGVDFQRIGHCPSHLLPTYTCSATIFAMPPQGS